jgi:hypothetical protein
MKIVLVEWYDAQSGPIGWKPMREVLTIEPALSKSVGYLLKEVKNGKHSYIVVCPHFTGVGYKNIDGDGEIAIPKSWIKRIVVLMDDKDVKHEHLLPRSKS